MMQIWRFWCFSMFFLCRLIFLKQMTQQQTCLKRCRIPKETHAGTLQQDHDGMIQATLQSHSNRTHHFVRHPSTSSKSIKVWYTGIPEARFPQNCFGWVKSTPQKVAKPLRNLGEQSLLLHHKSDMIHPLKVKNNFSHEVSGWPMARVQQRRLDEGSSSACDTTGGLGT